MISAMAKTVAGILLLFLLFPIQSIAQDSLSTIYFYRAKKSGSSMRYDVKEGETQVGRMKPGSVAVYHCKPGSHDFAATGKTSSAFQMTTEPGKEYYVDCFVLRDQPAFLIATMGEARRQIARIDKTVSEKISGVVITTSPDTVKALQHMFKRKRVTGIVCTTVGTIVTPFLVVSLMNYEPEVIRTTSGGLVTTTTIDERPRYIAGVFNGSVAIIGGTFLWVNHTPKKLTAILENKAEGIPFAPRMLKHLKRKDFK
jgi:hypothetical protein